MKVLIVSASLMLGALGLLANDKKNVEGADGKYQISVVLNEPILIGFNVLNSMAFFQADGRRYVENGSIRAGIKYKTGAIEDIHGYDGWNDAYAVIGEQDGLPLVREFYGSYESIGMNLTKERRRHTKWGNWYYGLGITTDYIVSWFTYHDVAYPNFPYNCTVCPIEIEELRENWNAEREATVFVESRQFKIGQVATIGAILDFSKRFAFGAEVATTAGRLFGDTFRITEDLEFGNSTQWWIDYDSQLNVSLHYKLGFNKSSKKKLKETTHYN